MHRRSALLAVIGAVAVVLGVASPAGAIAAPSASHPYSSPVWYPLLDSAAKMDCATSNPGCASGHTDESIDLGTSPDSQPVTAAGAGKLIVVVDNVSDTCPASGPHTLGNYVYIDHGAGVRSRYSHLKQALAPGLQTGSYVAAGQTIGYTWNSGLTGPTCSRTKYLNFEIRHNYPYSGNGVGTAYPIGQLKACSRPVAGASQVLLPSFQYPQYTSWNQLPATSTITEPGTTCIPSTAPNTPPSPRDVALVNNGPGRLKFTWTKPSTGPAIKYISYEFQYFSTSLNRWAYVDPSTPFTSITVGTTFPTTRYFLNLRKGTKYQARVWFNGGDGWSLEGYWKIATST